MKRDKQPPADADRAELERQVETLQRDIRNLQLEHDLLKKANEILKKDLGVNLQFLGNREKTALVDALREEYTLPEILYRAGLARSSYFYHRSRMEIIDKYASVRRTIADIFESNHQSYGYRRIRASLNRQRVFVSEKVVQRLMKQERLQVAKPKLSGYCSYVGGDYTCAGECHPSRCPCRSAKRKMAHRYFAAPDPCRQSVSFTHDRLL